MKHITLEEFRGLIDEMGLNSKKIDDRVLAVTFQDDEDGVDFIVRFFVGENRIQAWICIPGLGVELDRADALEFCNKWNKEKVLPKVYIDKDKDFIAENTLLTDEEISEEFVKTNFIAFGLSTMYQFLTALRKFSETGVFED